LLANWGKLGRDTLKTLGKFQAETELAHCAIEPNSLLKAVQFDLLHFRTEKRRIEGDDSIEISLTGSSRLREVEALRDGIFRLVGEKGIEFSEISVLAPDIQIYAPFIDLIFSDPECSLPYRLFGIDIRLRSPFSQGLTRLASLLGGKWEVEEVLSLFETPSFYRKQNWDGETLERFRNWVSAVSIEWGIDGDHRKKILQKDFGIDPVDPDRKSWEKGFENLLNRMVFLFPETGSQFQVRAEDLEELLSVFLRLKERSLEFKGEKALGLWAVSLESLAEEYLMADPKNEADSAALEGFRHFLKDLKQAEIHLQQQVFSFDPVRRFLIRPCPSQIRSSSLHAVRCSSIEEGAAIPARAVFLIGMEEGNFPRVKISSSLDLLKEKENCDGPIPDSIDQDRYLFLQSLFSAQEFLRISYCHLTPDEGKPINSSSLVQQFLSFLDSAFSGIDGPISESFSRSLQIVHPSIPFDPRCFGEKKIRSYSKTDFLTAPCLQKVKEKLAYWPDFSRCPESIFPEKEISIPISHLKKLARHPWRFYLQKVAGIFIEEEEIDSFSLQKSRALRSSLEGTGAIRQEEGPAGIFGEALHSEISENAQEWKNQLAEWGIERPFSLVLLENGEPKEEGARIEKPAIELHWEGGFKARIFGEIKPVSHQGILSTYEDQVSGLLKIWPEALAAAVALNAPQILLLKSGKIKPLVCPEESLKRFVEYYLRALQSPTPLLPEWGDALLKKGIPELRKKMEATFSSKRLFEDRVIDWVALRGQMPDADQISKGWGACLKETFSDLICTSVSARDKKGGSHGAV
jgi:exodeoxyribonuclease V gamma subunit